MSENTAHNITHNMPKNTPSDVSDPLVVEPISVMPPNIPHVILASNHPGSSSNPFGQTVPTEAEILEEWEGAARMAEKVAEIEQRRASKAKERERERGQWWPCDPVESDLKMLQEEGFLKDGSWRFVKGETVPAPRPDECIMTKAWVERGLSLPPSEFFLSVLSTYGLQPQNICPKSFLLLSNFATLCEGYLGVRPDVRLWQFFYRVKKETKDKVMVNCGSMTFVLRTKRIFPALASHESV